jgi:hypothetical protein
MRLSALRLPFVFLLRFLARRRWQTSGDDRAARTIWRIYPFQAGGEKQEGVRHAARMTIDVRDTMNNRIDTLILSLTSDRWQKVARIVALASDRAAEGEDFEMIAGRICVLVEEGKLQAKGDLSRWRHSEIRRAN